MYDLVPTAWKTGSFKTSPLTRYPHVVSDLGALHEGAYLSVRVVVLRCRVDHPLRRGQHADDPVDTGQEDDEEEAGQEDLEEVHEEGEYQEAGKEDGQSAGLSDL